MTSLLIPHPPGGGPLSSDKSLQYRRSGAYQANNSFRDFASLHRMVFSPGDATDLTLDKA